MPFYNIITENENTADALNDIRKIENKGKK